MKKGNIVLGRVCQNKFLEAHFVKEVQILHKHDEGFTLSVHIVTVPVEQTFLFLTLLIGIHFARQNKSQSPFHPLHISCPRPHVQVPTFPIIFGVNMGDSITPLI